VTRWAGSRTGEVAGPGVQKKGRRWWLKWVIATGQVLAWEVPRGPKSRFKKFTGGNSPTTKQACGLGMEHQNTVGFEGSSRKETQEE